MRLKTTLPLAAAMLLGLSACNQQQTAQQEAPKPEPQFKLTATIQELMDAEVDPSADFLWASVGFVATAKGVEDKSPKTDAQWDEVRHRALILAEASNLLLMPGRTVAHEGKTLDEEEKAGIEDPKEIERNIAMNRAAFDGFAGRLHDVSLKMLDAIAKRDLEAMGATGEELDAACEACHRTFWYPNAVEPIQTLEPPTEGAQAPAPAPAPAP
jgi:hypothetical protein